MKTPWWDPLVTFVVVALAVTYLSVRVWRARRRRSDDCGSSCDCH